MGSCCSRSVVFVRDSVIDIRWNCSQIQAPAPLRWARNKVRQDTRDIDDDDDEDETTIATQTEEAVFTFMKSSKCKQLQQLQINDEGGKYRTRNYSTEANSSVMSMDARFSNPDSSSVEEILTVIERLQTMCRSVNMRDQVSILCTINHLREYCVILTDMTNNGGKLNSKSFLDLEEKKRKDSAVNFWVSAYNGKNQTDTGIKKFKKMAVAVRHALTIANMSGAHVRSESLTLAETAVFGTISDETYNYIRTNIDNWNFDQFNLHQLSNQHGLSLIFSEALRVCGLLSEFKINSSLLTQYCIEIEKGYRKHGNPYHNEIHGADVLQTTYYLVTKTKITDWLSQIELLSLLFSAMIHDVEHTGTNNAFHLQSASQLAMLYNDKSVLENHHVSKAYRLLTEINPFERMTKAQFKSMREIVVECVLSTDMAVHFKQISTLKNSSIDLSLIERQDLLNMVLHCADISGPSKPWECHERWTQCLMQEFFAQGDQEKAMGFPVSPLCDRLTTNIPESQVGFITYITRPAFNALGNSIDAILRDKQEREFLQKSMAWRNVDKRRGTVQVSPLTPVLETGVDTENSVSTPLSPLANGTFYYKPIERVWDRHFDENCKIWQEKLDQS